MRNHTPWILILAAVAWLVPGAFAASIPGTLRVGAPIAPFDTADTYPTHMAAYGKGGLRTVADIAARDAIPAARREAWMQVRVASDRSIWELLPDLTTWRECSQIIEQVVGAGPGLVVGSGWASSAGTTTYRVRVPILTDARWIRLWFTGWKNVNGFETATAASYTIKASVELADGSGSPTGETVPVTFRGSRTATIEPKTIVGSDQIPITLPAGSIIYVRWFPNGTDVPLTLLQRHNWTGFNEGTAAGDAVDSGAIAAPIVYANQSFGGPVAVTGEVRAQDASGFFVMGDSITGGSMDLASATPSAGSLQGWVARGLAEAGRPYIRAAIGAELGMAVADSQAAAAARHWAARYCRYGVVNYGSNDFTGARTANQIVDDLEAIAARLKRAGIRRVAVSTLLPRNTSVDCFTTLTNQTLSPHEATRTNVNALLLSGAVTSADTVWDPVPYVATGPQYSLWRTNWGPAIAGVVTNTPTSTSNLVYTGSSLGITNSQADSWLIRFTSGALSGESRSVFHSWAGGLLGISSPFSTNPSPGDTLEVIPSYVDAPGIHPSAYGYDAMKLAVDVSTFVD